MCKGRNGENSWKVLSVTSTKHDSILTQGAGSGDDERWLDSGYILKIKPIEFSGFSKGFNKWYGEIENKRIIPKISLEQVDRWGFHE